MPKNIKESKDSLSRNYWNKIKYIYVNAQYRNIRERCVIFKKMIYGYNSWNLPNYFRYYPKKLKNIDIKTSKMTKKIKN